MTKKIIYPSHIKPKSIPQAFPCDTYLGMDLRDYFAGRALSGVLSGLSEVKIIGQGCERENGILADVAYALADAMLRAREKKAELKDEKKEND